MFTKFKLKAILKSLIAGLVFSVIVSSCGANLYQQAEMHLNHQENEAALAIYLNLMKSTKKPDIDAMIGAAIAYRNLEKRKPSMKLCRRVLKFEPKNAAALYYLGSSLEELGMEQLAMKCFVRYQEVSPDNPYYSFLKARMNIIKMRSKDFN